MQFLDGPTIAEVHVSEPKLDAGLAHVSGAVAVQPNAWSHDVDDGSTKVPDGLRFNV